MVVLRKTKLTLSSDPGNIPGDEEQSDGGKDEVTPLVGRSNESANKTCNNHDLIHEDGVQNGRPWETSSQE